MKRQYFPDNQGLYNSKNEHDACGVGVVANIKGESSHDLILKAVEVLERIEHRGAVGGDPGTGDGAGLLLQIPDKFFRKVFSNELPEAKSYGIGMFFLPKDATKRKECKDITEKVLKDEGITNLGWREVPTDNSTLGKMAKASEPFIEQLFVSKGDQSEIELDRTLFTCRRIIEKTVTTSIDDLQDSFYICSMSSRTIVYKGMLMAPQVMQFYKDLSDESFKSHVVVVHQRYSTNTFPSWPLAHPFRYTAHNGEINTLRGNVNQMRARENRFECEELKFRTKDLLPIIQEGNSDSACLDNAVEFFYLGGRSLAHTMMMLVPQAFGANYDMSSDLRGFYDFHSAIMEPWDGPAALAFTDGDCLGATLDRNGLRPIRYTITKDNMLLLASEAGTIDIPWENVKKKGRLSPGAMLYIDFNRGKLYSNRDIKRKISRQQPYRRWVEENRINLDSGVHTEITFKEHDQPLVTRQKLYNYTREDLKVVLAPMAKNGIEATGSMGNDAALAILSERPQLMFSYFKQLFAQVTNPAIDPIREELVTSLSVFLGDTDNILQEGPELAKLLKLTTPVLTNEDIHLFRSSKNSLLKTETIAISYPVSGGEAAMRQALKDITQQAEAAVNSGAAIIILSDVNLADGCAPLPALLATSTVHNHLIDQGLRSTIGIFVETAEAREVHHFAVLLGYGATAINPYLALETIADMVKNGHIEKTHILTAVKNYIKAINKGLKKVMSKMGISTLRSYRGAQIFEAIGLNSKFINEYFPNTTSKIQGIGLDTIYIESRQRYENTFSGKASKILDGGGDYHFRVKGEKHLWSPTAITNMQEAIKINDANLYKSYANEINNQAKKLCTLRGLFEFKSQPTIDISEVEPAAEIMKRFVTGAMSLGSISPEVHETIAIAMNRISGMSNSGEGGEDAQRFKTMANGDSKCSAIKQVASGRFGVTIEYLSNCREIQIKVAQGAKPGEGGQLPGHKVNDLIAKVRHSTPGVTLISPPPHHDIYSIEDLAQLIFDLKNANPKARISVKLVSEVGVGTIAAGVSKGHADMVLVSGHDGGTGASPLTSIKHAGLPWELGLAETQQTLILNQLRDRIRVQVDGQLKTGRDVVIGALLGAEEFGFGTTALVSMGCVMMRKCHSNTCPVGVATQDTELRKKFQGKPEYLINFLTFVAEEVREIMAELGFKKFDDMVGRSDILEMNSAIDFWKTKNLDFAAIFHKPVSDHDCRCTTTQNHGLENILDNKLLTLAKENIDNRTKGNFKLPICNLNRTAGTMLSGYIAKMYGIDGLEEDSINFKFKGTAGQSFAAFLAHGVTFRLAGEANDFVAKGLSGGKVIVHPPKEATYKSDKNSIIGNVALYGATAGELYASGQAGERFAIRNSGALAVVETVGDHCCEYMTGGKVIVLGKTGVNFAAGMSGGLAYIFDEKEHFNEQCNLSMVDLEMITDQSEMDELRVDIENHYRYTNSQKAKAILDDWEDSLDKFVKVFPIEYKKVLGRMMKQDAAKERSPQQD